LSPTGVVRSAFCPFAGKNIVMVDDDTLVESWQLRGLSNRDSVRFWFSREGFAEVWWLAAPEGRAAAGQFRE
jgi:hypothetical protein